MKEYRAIVDEQTRARLAKGLAVLVASVWLYHGLFNKLLHAEPRHLRIVQSIPHLSGETGEFVLVVIGILEVLLAAWVLSGRRPALCATVQTCILIPMNIVELTWARPHLLWPAGLLPVNLLFLTLAWLAAGLPRRAECDAKPRLRAVGPHILRRHPIPIRAHFEHALVLTYAFPQEILRPMLPPGLTLDTFNGFGFLAIAMVQTRDLRPAGLPRACGQDFFLTGYRIFTKFRTPAGRTMRGLRIIRSDANRRLMVVGGNLLTHYNYQNCDAFVRASRDELDIAICTPGGQADLHVVAGLNADSALPAGSPFRSLSEARRFAGPLPFTFDYEPQTHSIIAIQGVRENWNPRLVSVDVRQVNLFNQFPFRKTKPLLASAFYIRDIHYRWNRGVRFALPKERT